MQGVDEVGSSWQRHKVGNLAKYETWGYQGNAYIFMKIRKYIEIVQTHSRDLSLPLCYCNYVHVLIADDDECVWVSICVKGNINTW